MPPLSLNSFPQSSGPISEDGLGASMASLSSENPYATIRDLPSLLGGPRESSYVEMKGPPSGSPHRQPPQLPASQRPRYPQPRPQPQRDSGTYEQPSALPHGEPPPPLGQGLERWKGEGTREGERDRERGCGGVMLWQQEQGPWGSDLGPGQA